MISMDAVTKNFGNFKALDQVDLHVAKGSVYGLVGPNGAGKTTLLKILAGVYRPDGGAVSVDGVPVYENVDVKQRMAFIPDELHFLPLATPKSLAAFYGDIYREFDWERYRKIQGILELDERQKVSKMSKGMRKQVSFWLSMACRPDVLVLDEPVDGLDPVMRRQIWSLLLQDVAERQMTVLVSSHNLRELEDVCDHVGILNKGKMLLERDLDEMKSDIHKIQVAYGPDVAPGVLEEREVSLDILKKERSGSVSTYIVRGAKAEVEPVVLSLSPLLFEFIPLTLEEIFMYEIGGAGYEVKNILL
ncbi:ABC transporter ATP-binding protein [Anaerotalea alkaliphila]|uniref:ABC transporter ATP-binding protein n=1 Tax=Anaerotalea alkaliphila TaxID=2662126 RepID=A0A7X5KMX4_9FIRM|nr:ABC transporter ATP-binding protein [Anaerotalea alkaliphila]NDL66212.1 ABC transporter ATP-binding protein [Anaerotalea alkaliphila]